MKIPFSIVLVLISLWGLTACKKDKNNAKKTPSIAYVGLSANKVKAGSGEGVIVQFRFADGDGDLGNTASAGKFDIYTIDSRDTANYNYYFPYEMIAALPPGEPVEGTCQLTLVGDLFVLRPDHPDGDTVRFELYIKDRAGNASNHFTTPDIYIMP